MDSAPRPFPHETPSRAVPHVLAAELEEFFTEGEPACQPLVYPESDRTAGAPVSLCAAETEAVARIAAQSLRPA